MIFSDIKPGQKINIRILQEVNRADKEKKGEALNYFASRVFDVLNGDFLELEMPTREGKLLLLPVNIRYEFIFVFNSGMYRAEGIITERYKKKNFYLIKAKITSPFVKFQRREYYRLNCMIPVEIFGLSDRIEMDESATDYSNYMISDDKTPYQSAKGTILDISGGGIRMVSEQYIDNVSYFLVRFDIDIQGQSSMIELLAKKIAIQKLDDSNNYSYRFKFVFREPKLQERIIHFIFEEERRIRKKEQWVRKKEQG